MLLISIGIYYCMIVVLYGIAMFFSRNDRDPIKLSVFDFFILSIGWPMAVFPPYAEYNVEWIVSIIAVAIGHGLIMMVCDYSLTAGIALGLIAITWYAALRFGEYADEKLREKIVGS